MVNKDLRMTENRRQVLDVFTDVYQTSPGQIQERTGIKKQRINDTLQSFIDAGWVTKVSRGLYQLEYNGECFVTNEVRCIDDE